MSAQAEPAAEKMEAIDASADASPKSSPGTSPNSKKRKQRDEPYKDLKVEDLRKKLHSLLPEGSSIGISRFPRALLVEMMKFYDEERKGVVKQIKKEESDLRKLKKSKKIETSTATSTACSSTCESVIA